MRTELVSIETDTVRLDGAYYEPDNGEIKGAVQLFHGNCMNFYVGAPRFLPPALTDLGFACLAYNRRGHDVLSTYNSRYLLGGAFQTTAEAVADNRYAGEWLTGKGHGNPILAGHSNGGMLAVQHAADHPDTPALILLSAHAGGANIAKTISERGLWAGKKYDQTLMQAQRYVDDGDPHALILMDGWWRVISAESALDYTSTVPSTIELAPKITCPVLYLRGDQEPEDIYPATKFSQHCSGPCDVEIIADCDHFYNGRETAVSDVVANWLKRRM